MPIVQILNPSRTLNDPLRPLDKSLDVVTLPLSEVSRKKVPRWQLQAFAQEHTEKKNIALCGRGFRVIDAEGVATPVACQNSWTCPRCTPRNLRTFANESADVINAAASVLAFTFTQKRENGEALVDALNRLAKTVKTMTSGRAWVALKKKYGITGMGYVVELKHSPTGWHPHLHGFLVSTSDLTQEQGGNAGHAIRRRWTQHSDGAALSAQQVNLLDSAEYFLATRYLQKDSPRYTTTSPLTRTVGDLLHDAHHGDVEALDLYLEAERASAKKRRFVWTPNVLDRLQDALYASVSA